MPSPAVLELADTSLFQEFNLPAAAGSMKPTLLIGARFVVSKYSYRHSCEPQRGDPVAFRQPKDGSTVSTKPVVGLPGDRNALACWMSV
jgi:hypothetical protein